MPDSSNGHTPPKTPLYGTPAGEKATLVKQVRGFMLQRLAKETSHDG